MNESKTLLDALCERAKANPQRIAFAEAFDERVMEAAFRISSEGMGFPVLVGDAAQLKALCVERGYDQALFEFADVNDQELIDGLVARYEGYPRAKLQGEELAATMSDPLWLAMVMQAVGEVRLAPAGYIATTAQVARAVIKIIRPNEYGLMSSIGLVQLPGKNGDGSDFKFLADISVCPDPTAEQLARIAIDSCDTARALLGVEPACAMLSYSTKGSASGPIVQKVVDATRIAKELRPDLQIEGELQLDAAVDPVIGAKKAGADNPVAGKANVLVFPDLNASNIAVKIMEQFAGGKLFGAILQGLQMVSSDSSRGAALDELIGTIVAATVLAVEKENQTV